MSSSLLISCATLLIVIVTVESVYPAFTYDDGNDGEDHCCLVRVRENLCFATPITRSLLQVNKQCSQKSGQGHGKLHLKNRNRKYFDLISERLVVKTSQKIGGKVIIELSEPLDKKVLANDLLCLTASNTSINLNKCYIELADDDDTDDDPNNDDDDEDDESSKGKKGKSRQAKNADVNKEKDDDKTDSDTDTDASDNESQRIEVSEPVRVREGHGLLIRHKYKLNFDDVRPTNRQQRQCWSWYNKQWKAARQEKGKKKRCVKLNDHTEHCLHQLLYRPPVKTQAAAEEEKEEEIEETEEAPAVDEPKHSATIIPVGSKLICENRVGNEKLIGLHRRSRICFDDRNRLSVDHSFSDIASLSDHKKNKPVLEFLANNEQYKAEFENDCHDKTTLEEVTDDEKETTPSDDEEHAPDE